MEQPHFHRRNLPHLYFESGTYFITYRLFGSMPKTILNELKEKLYCDLSELCELEIYKLQSILNKYETLLNNGEYLPKYLANPSIAEICKNTIHYYDGNQYKLICYCIMPNHVHIVFTLLPGNKGISKIMQSIKRVSAKKSNILLNKSGSFWQEESYDRFVRDDKELFFTVNYVIENPVKAGLVSDWREWRYIYLCKGYL
jgi:putative transposase